MVQRRTINVKQSPEARLTRIAVAATGLDEPIRYRLLGMLFDAEARQWISDRRDGIYIEMTTEAEVAKWQKLIEQFVNTTAHYGVAKVRRALDGVE